jgi:hypothetical protein
MVAPVKLWLLRRFLLCCHSHPSPLSDAELPTLLLIFLQD